MRFSILKHKYLLFLLATVVLLQCININFPASADSREIPFGGGAYYINMSYTNEGTSPVTTDTEFTFNFALRPNNTGNAFENYLTAQAGSAPTAQDVLTFSIPKEAMPGAKSGTFSNPLLSSGPRLFTDEAGSPVPFFTATSSADGKYYEFKVKLNHADVLSYLSGGGVITTAGFNADGTFTQTVGNADWLVKLVEGTTVYEIDPPVVEDPPPDPPKQTFGKTIHSMWHTDGTSLNRILFSGNFSERLEVGDIVVFRLAVKNDGTTPININAIYDNLPAGFDYWGSGTKTFDMDGTGSGPPTSMTPAQFAAAYFTRNSTTANEQHYLWDPYTSGTYPTGATTTGTADSNTYKHTVDSAYNPLPSLTTYGTYIFAEVKDAMNYDSGRNEGSIDSDVKAGAGVDIPKGTSFYDYAIQFRTGSDANSMRGYDKYGYPIPMRGSSYMPEITHVVTEEGGYYIPNFVLYNQGTKQADSVKVRIYIPAGLSLLVDTPTDLALQMNGSPAFTGAGTMYTRVVGSSPVANEVADSTLSSYYDSTTKRFDLSSSPYGDTKYGKNFEIWEIDLDTSALSIDHTISNFLPLKVESNVPHEPLTKLPTDDNAYDVSTMDYPYQQDYLISAEIVSFVPKGSDAMVDYDSIPDKNVVNDMFGSPPSSVPTVFDPLLAKLPGLERPHVVVQHRWDFNASYTESSPRTPNYGDVYITNNVDEDDFDFVTVISRKNVPDSSSPTTGAITKKVARPVGPVANNPNPWPTAWLNQLIAVLADRDNYVSVDQNGVLSGNLSLNHYLVYYLDINLDGMMDLHPTNPGDPASVLVESIPAGLKLMSETPVFYNTRSPDAAGIFIDRYSGYPRTIVDGAVTGITPTTVVGTIDWPGWTTRPGWPGSSYFPPDGKRNIAYKKNEPSLILGNASDYGITMSYSDTGGDYGNGTITFNFAHPGAGADPKLIDSKAGYRIVLVYELDDSYFSVATNDKIVKNKASLTTEAGSTTTLETENEWFTTSDTEVARKLNYHGVDANGDPIYNRNPAIANPADIVNGQYDGRYRIDFVGLGTVSPSRTPVVDTSSSGGNIITSGAKAWNITKDLDQTPLAPADQRHELEDTSPTDNKFQINAKGGYGAPGQTNIYHFNYWMHYDNIQYGTKLVNSIGTTPNDVNVPMKLDLNKSNGTDRLTGYKIAMYYANGGTKGAPVLDIDGNQVVFTSTSGAFYIIPDIVGGGDPFTAGATRNMMLIEEKVPDPLGGKTYDAAINTTWNVSYSYDSATSKGKFSIATGATGLTNAPDSHNAQIFTALNEADSNFDFKATKTVSGTAIIPSAGRTFNFDLVPIVSGTTGAAVAKGELNVLPTDKGKQVDIEFTLPIAGTPITDWSGVLQDGVTYRLVETNPGDYSVSYSRTGGTGSAPNEFVADFSGTTPLITINAVNAKDADLNFTATKTVTGSADIPAGGKTFNFILEPYNLSTGATGAAIAFGELTVMPADKGKQVDIVFKDSFGAQITDWKNFLTDGNSYRLTEVNPGEYAVTFTGGLPGNPNAFTVNMSLTDPSITVHCTNTLNSYDAALMKWIEGVSETPGNDDKYSSNTPEYNTAVPVEIGDYVNFRIDIYNQCHHNVKTPEISDYLPAHLEFVSTPGVNPGWTYNSTTNVATYDWSNRAGGAPTLTPPNFNTGGILIDYPASSKAQINIVLRVKDTIPTTGTTNFAEISVFTDENDKPVEDIDSKPDDNDSNDGQPKDNEIDNGDGDEDDHDFASVIPAEYDAALIKWIKGVSTLDDKAYNVYHNTTDIPETTPVKVNIGDYVTFRLEIFNQCHYSVKTPVITDYIPTYLDFVDDPLVNPGWTYVDNPGVNAGQTATYNWPSGAPTLTPPTFSPGGILIDYPASSKTYIEITLKVKGTLPVGIEAVNFAEISEFTDKNDYPVDDIDSIPDADSGNDGTPEDNQIDEHRYDKKVIDNTQDEDDHDFARVIVDKAIRVACEVDKDTIKRTSAAYKSLPNKEGINNVGKEEYMYEVDFRSTSNMDADEYVVDDPLENVSLNQVRLTGLWTPIVWGDVDGQFNVWYKTNKTPNGYKDPSNASASIITPKQYPNDGYVRWANKKNDAQTRGMYKTTTRYKLNISDLKLAKGEYITAVRYEYGPVLVGFTSKNYSDKSLNGEHRDNSGKLSLPSDNKGKLRLLSAATVHTGVLTDSFTFMAQNNQGKTSNDIAPLALAASGDSLASFATGIGANGDVDWTPDDKRDDYYALGAANAKGLQPAAYLVEATREMSAEDIVSSVSSRIALGTLKDLDQDAVVTKQIVTFTTNPEELNVDTQIDEDSFLNNARKAGVTLKGGRLYDNNGNPLPVKTGDNVAMGLWLILLTASGICIIHLCYLRYADKRRRVLAKGGLK